MTRIRLAGLLLLLLTVILAYATTAAQQQSTTDATTNVRDSVNTENLLATDETTDTLITIIEAPVIHIWTASYYGKGFFGRKTANGEIYNDTMMTCAHRTLPFGTILYVTNTHNGEHVRVRVNDRGPFIKGRQLDLSYQAAKRLGMLQRGVIKAKVTIMRE